jgi:hypothetical protein
MARLPEGAERSLWGSGDVCREDPEIPQRPFYRDLWAPRKIATGLDLVRYQIII